MGMERMSSLVGGIVREDDEAAVARPIAVR